MLNLNFKRYEDQLFHIVTFVYWNIVYIESCMYKSVLGKINKLQKQNKYTPSLDGIEPTIYKVSIQINR